MAFDFDVMTEADVREVVVRPLLHRLGYAFGQEASIRTEVPLTYAKSFLGRKKPDRDPPLRGRADYVCDATSYGRWVVEVKSPRHPLADEDAHQAHTYSAHPEIAATHFLLSNGREFRLYATGQLQKPLLQWAYEETDGIFLNLSNILSFEAVKARSGLLAVDLNKPLAAGYPSRMEVVAGDFAYGTHNSTHPLFANVRALVGQVGQVTGGRLERALDGRLHSTLMYRSPIQQVQPLIEAMGNDRFEFFSSDEFVSTDIERPTIFQNATTGKLEPGTMVPLFFGQPPIPMPIGFDAVVWTEATGFIDGDHFVGIARCKYRYNLIPGIAAHPLLQGMVDAAIAEPVAELEGEATFKLRVAGLRAS